MVAAILEGPRAVAAFRQLAGGTDPVEKAVPGSIRGDFGLETQFNLVHGSDSTESAEREIGLWFPVADPEPRLLVRIGPAIWDTGSGCPGVRPNEDLDVRDHRGAVWRGPSQPSFSQAPDTFSRGGSGETITSPGM